MKININDFTYQISFKHYYLPERRKGKVELHPRATQCTITIKYINEPEPVKYFKRYKGYSICSEQDQFSKEMGRFQSLINCFKENGFANEIKKEIITQYLLEFRYKKLEQIVLNTLNLYTVDYRYLAIRKDTIGNEIHKDNFQNGFIKLYNYKEDFTFEELNPTYYFKFDSKKDDSKKFVRECMLQLINRKYKLYYS